MPKSRHRKKKTPAKLAAKPTAKPQDPRIQQKILDGVSRYEAGDHSSAAAILLGVLKSAPGDPTANTVLGAICQARDEFTEAESYFSTALKSTPGSADAHYNHALALTELGRYEHADAAVTKALELHPDHARAWNTVGRIAMGMGDFTRASEALSRAVRLDPGLIEAWVNYSGALQELGQDAEAQNAGRRACELMPGLPVAHYNLARAYDGATDWSHAIEEYTETLRLDPQFVDGYVNYSRCLTKSGDPQTAERAARTAIELAPQNAEAHNNLGLSQVAQALYSEAIQEFSQAILLDPSLAEAHNNLGRSLLTTEQFKTGWTEYEYGFLTGDRGIPVDDHPPLWRGESLDGRKIHVIAEQGIGEHIMFSTMIVDLLDMGADVTYQCDERLVNILARSLPGLRTVPIHDGTQAALSKNSADYQIVAGSIGQWLRQSPEAFKPSPGFLIPDPVRVQDFRERYSELGDGLKIGISWKSVSQNHATKKSVPLELWGPILQQKSCHFVNLQYGDVADDLEMAHEIFGVEIFQDPHVSYTDDFDVSAAQVSALDLVISISNATVHVAGACGVPTWTLLATPSLWHWFRERDSCLWYNSVKLFRREENDDWHSLINLISGALGTLVDRVIPGESQ